MSFSFQPQQKTSQAESLASNWIPTILSTTTLALPLIYYGYERWVKYNVLSRKMRSDLQSDNSQIREAAVNKLLNDFATEKESMYEWKGK